MVRAPAQAMTVPLQSVPLQSVPPMAVPLMAVPISLTWVPVVLVQAGVARR
jgi:hypothetical protein